VKIQKPGNQEPELLSDGIAAGQGALSQRAGLGNETAACDRPPYLMLHQASLGQLPLRNQEVRFLFSWLLNSKF
jgi:hypothetical protein